MALLIGIIVFLLFLCSVKNIFYGLLIQNPGDVKAFSASIFDAWIFRSLHSRPFSCLFAYCSDISVPCFLIAAKAMFSLFENKFVSFTCIYCHSVLFY